MRSLADLRIRHIPIQVDTPSTNGEIEAFWATLQTEVLDRPLSWTPEGDGRRSLLRDPECAGAE